MNIIYASDDKFSQMLGISMVSLFENNRECGKITVYILDDGISGGSKRRINSVGEKYGREIIYISVQSLQIPPEVQSLRWSKSAFTRIFLRQLLPEGTRRALYLDCDIIVRKGLEEFYNTQLGDCFGAGVRDCVSKNYLRNLGLMDDDLYCNSGVLLINMDRWESGVFMDFLKTHVNVLTYPDQDVINGVCSKEMICADVGCNCYTALFDFSYADLLAFRRPVKYYSESEILAAKSDPVIVHFTQSFLSLRPWVKGCGHPFAAEWKRYKEMSPWADVPEMTDGRGAKKKFAVRIYNLLPKKLAVRLAGLLHSAVLPLMKRVKR